MPDLDEELKNWQQQQVDERHREDQADEQAGQADRRPDEPPHLSQDEIVDIAAKEEAAGVVDQQTIGEAAKGLPKTGGSTADPVAGRFHGDAGAPGDGKP